MAFPKFLYKYTDHFGIEILRNLQLKVTPPDQLNDPFELQAYFIQPVAAAHIQDLLATSPIDLVYEDMKANGENVGTLDEFKSFTQKAAPLWIHYGADQFQRAYQETIRNYVNDFSKEGGIVCLSEHENEPLLWAHYADKHQGMLIEFNCAHIYFRLYSRFRKVTYPKDKLPFDPNIIREAQMKEFMAGVFYRKTESWAYEAEWRGAYQLKACLPQTVNGNDMYFTHIPSDLISRIVLGHRCPKEIESEARQIISTSRPTIRLQRAMPHASEMRMEYIDI